MFQDKMLHSLVGPQDLPVHWTDVLNVLQAINQQENDCKYSNEEERNKSNQQSEIPNRIAKVCSYHIAAVGTLIVGHWILTKHHRNCYGLMDHVDLKGKINSIW